MAIKRPYEENIDGQDSNVPPPVTGTTSAAGATSNGSRRVVAVLQVGFVNCFSFIQAACTTTCIQL
jgi:hypothetical protein